jgi:hypothetical protein
LSGSCTHLGFLVQPRFLLCPFFSLSFIESFWHHFSFPCALHLWPQHSVEFHYFSRPSCPSPTCAQFSLLLTLFEPPWRWRQWALPLIWYLYTSQHGIISQNTGILNNYTIWLFISVHNFH